MVFWVFGYGSLVWNPGFEYDEKVIGFIKDYKRVFDLGKCIPNIQGKQIFHMTYSFSFLLLSFLIIIAFAYRLFYVPACIDHRGTPENPARTCTLERNEGAVCVSVLNSNAFSFLNLITRFGPPTKLQFFSLKNCVRLLSFQIVSDRLHSKLDCFPSRLFVCI